MTKLNFFLVFFLSFTSGICWAQKSSIHGTVRNSQSKKPLIGVSVFNENNQGEITDDNGYYSFTMASGNHEITFSSIGYSTKKVVVNLKGAEEKNLDIYLDPVTNELDAVVISAGKFEQKESEITMSVAVIRPAVIEDKAITSMDDILQNTSGVAIIDNEPQIRGGSGFSFGAGSRVTVMVDDMSMLSGDAGRPSWGFLPVENIEQVEVIKGASSVLYGSSALSGVINIRTGFAKAVPQTKVTLLHGFYSKPKTLESRYWSNTPMKSGVNFFHSRKIKDFDLVMGISILGDDGYMGPILTPLDTIINANNEEVIHYDTASSKYSPFTANRYDSEFRYRGNVNMRYHPKAVPGLIFGLNTNWLKGESMASLLWENSHYGLYQPLDGAATRTKQIVGNIDPSVMYLSKKGTKHVLRGRWYKLSNDNDNNQSNFSVVKFGEYQIQQNFDSLGVKNLTVTGGIVASHTDSESDLFKGIDTTGISVFTNQAAYLQLDKKFFEKLNVSVGMRYERFTINGETEAKPVFRSGVNYQVAKATYLRASYGQGYRFPSIAERYIRTTVGSLTIFPNDSLQSETSSNLEFGIRQGIKKGKFTAMIDAAVFHQVYHNFIEFTFGQWEEPTFFPVFNNLGLGFRSVNTGDAVVNGFEINISGIQKINKLEFGLQLGYTYTKPVSLSPDYVYSSYEGNNQVELFSTASYNTTSSNTEDNILKYRIQHLARAEFTLGYKNINFGTSFRLNSQMQNVDEIYYTLDDPDFDLYIPFGFRDWTSAHAKPDFIIDTRISYTVKEIHKFSFIVNNLLNREYSMRPLKVEAPRTTVIQYVLNF